MYPKISLPFAHEPTTGPYHEETERSPHLQNSFPKISFNILSKDFAPCMELCFNYRHSCWFIYEENFTSGSL